MSSFRSIGDIELIGSESIDLDYDRLILWDASASVNKTKAIVPRSLVNILNNSGVTSVNNLSGTVVLTPNIIGAANLVHTHTASQLPQLVGATSTVAGSSGLVPPPAIGDNSKFLSGDGTWKSISTGYTNQDAIAAVGSAWQDTSSIDFTYNSGLGQLSVAVVFGNQAGQVCQGNDSRLSDNRTPIDGSITNVKVATNAAISWTKLDKTGSAISDINGLQNALDLKISTVEKGAVNGVASLDSNAKLPTEQLPESVIGSVSYKGVWDSSTNTPAIPSATTTQKGWYYVVSNNVASNHGYPNVPTISFAAGDWIICNGSTWDKLDATDQVFTVHGRTGNIIAQTGDYTTDQVTEGTNKYFSNTLARTALSGGTAISYNSSTGVIAVNPDNLIVISYDQSSKPSSPTVGQYWLERTSFGLPVTLWRYVLLHGTTHAWVTEQTYQVNQRTSQTSVNASVGTTWTNFSGVDQAPSTYAVPLISQIGDGIVCLKAFWNLNLSRTYASNASYFPIFGLTFTTIGTINDAAMVTLLNLQGNPTSGSLIDKIYEVDLDPTNTTYSWTYFSSVSNYTIPSILRPYYKFNAGGGSAGDNLTVYKPFMGVLYKGYKSP